ncbi:MAG: hypothetical protein A3I06_03575 [Candidatus Lindowbacteria bacterium RIFCSPLOWO2_02_FULL_62_12]|nr:MAG: hypothetical protein A3I06_03575 [Candidatus Lindowbacteria bacterium RIFCSPLOWO2_02_FULL_62_12]
MLAMNRILKWSSVGLISLAACLLPVASPESRAQLSEEELRRERLETVEELRRTETEWEKYIRSRGWSVSYGGWLSSSFGSSDNDDRNRSVQDSLDHTWDQEFRWFYSGRSGTGRTRWYARFGTNYTFSSAIIPSIRHSDWVQPGIDMIYMERDFKSARRKHTLTVGRQFVQVENSIALAQVADGLKYDLRTARQTFEVFLLRQQSGDNNVDFLAPRAGRTRRWFTGLQYTASYLPTQSVNFFWVWNNDGNSESPDAAGQRHQLDSRYLGLTLSGRFFSKLKYDLQYIQEFGTTYSGSNATNASNTAPSAKIKVDANAFTGGLKYYFGGILSMVAHSTYYSGSGDPDAIDAFTSTGGSGSLDGSGTGGRDKRFMAFGGKSLGYALAPTLTNLSVIKNGFSLKPFGWSENRFWEDLSVHPQAFFYRRNEPTGKTSDPYINIGAGASAKVGHEVDLDISWRLMSDVKYNLKWGKFFPGSAYPTRSAESILRFRISVDL